MGDDHMGWGHECRYCSCAAAVAAHRPHLVVKLQKANLDGALQLLKMDARGGLQGRDKGADKRAPKATTDPSRTMTMGVGAGEQPNKGRGWSTRPNANGVGGGFR